MEIPQNCQDVLLNGIQHVGSANADLLPSQNYAHGSRLDLVEGTLTIFVQKNFCKNVVRDSETSKRAVFYSALPSHEAYQVKGDVVSVAPLSEADVSESQQYCDQVIQTLTELGFSPDIPKKIWGRVADTGITIELEQIFNQTPGPEAGKPISK